MAAILSGQMKGVKVEDGQRASAAGRDEREVGMEDGVEDWAEEEEDDEETGGASMRKSSAKQKSTGSG